MNKAIPVLNYSTFYVGSKPSEHPIEMFDGYDVEDVILTMVGIRNSLERSNYDYEKDGAIKAIMGCLPPEKANRLKYFIYCKPGFSLVQPAVIDRILVDLFRRLNADMVTKRIFGDGHFEQCILDVLLSYNEFHYSNNIVDDIVNSHQLVWKLVMMQGVSGIDKVDFARTGPIKHLVMLDFLRKSLGKQFPLLQESLEKEAKLDNIHQFLGTFLQLFSYLENHKGKEILLPQIQSNDPLKAFMEPMGLVMTKQVTMDERFDIGMLLARPFYETSKGATVILDHRNFSLLVERVFMYLLYYKSDYPKLACIKNLNGLFSHFGKHYYEGFLMHKLLGFLKRQDVRIIPSDDKHLADFTLIVNETDVFVIEVKSVAIHYNVFDTQNVDEFQKYIDDNYLIGAGTPQLQRFIHYLKDDGQKLLNIQKPASKLNIFPILIFTDPQAATYGVNDYVGLRANIEFEKYKPEFNKVMSLTMISSNFFVENIKLLKKDRNLLKKLIKEYHFFIKRRKQLYEKNQSIQNYGMSMVSFDGFAIGKHGAYRVPQSEIFSILGDVFGLKEPDPSYSYQKTGSQPEK